MTKRTDQKAATKLRVLQEARVLFSMLSYEDVSIRDIARQARVSTGGVFSSFESKEAIFREAMAKAPPTLVAPHVPRLLASAKIALANWDNGRKCPDLTDAEYDVAYAELKAAIAAVERA